MKAPPRLKTYASLRDRNYRLYFIGQLISSIGTWSHQIAESWLVLQITGSGFAVGTVIAARFVPVLALGLWGGAIADRFDKRRVLYISQTMRAVAAASLGLLAVTDSATTTAVLAMALFAGTANAVDNPVRRAFIGDLVDDDLIMNAVSLNSTVMATSRVIGPLLAGALIATVGVGWCFLVNAVSYVAVLVALSAMDGSRFRQRVRDRAVTGTVREGLHYVARSPGLLVPLAMVGVVSAFAWNWETLLALHATRQFGGGARLYTIMFAALSVGTFVGALAGSTRSKISSSQLVPMAGALGVAMLAVSVVRGIPLTLAMLAVSGAGAATFNTASNAVVQIAARGDFHGRVMALFSTLFVGTKGIGGAAAGAMAEGWGTRTAIAVSAAGCLVAAGGAAVWFRRLASSQPAQRSSLT